MLTSLLEETFNQYITDNDECVIVAVSGGADSMALTYMLSEYCREKEIIIYAVTIDHGLRSESKKEAEGVAEIVKKWPNVEHHSLRWDNPPESRIQESARAARYDLLKDFALNVKATKIFTGHHLDDQGETFLIRLSKGSGLDGLSGMKNRQDLGEGIDVIRPLLDMTHDDLKGYCKSNGIEWIEDPSNQNDKFLRPRLREARSVLENEGLSNKRLSKTAERLGRAKEALENITDATWDTIRVSDHAFSLSKYLNQEKEIRVRILLKVFNTLRPEADYAPRMEKVEALEEALCSKNDKVKKTLGGCIISMKRSDDIITFEKEKT